MAIVEYHVDVVVTPDDIRDEGPGPAPGDADVTAVISEAGMSAAALVEVPARESQTGAASPAQADIVEE